MNISKIIRQDKEFLAYLECFKSSIQRDTTLPIVINGLSGGATDAFITETVVENLKTDRRPLLILTPDDTERGEIASMLLRSGLRVAEYKARELVFHNISASHDVDRERLLVLSKIADGSLDAVVTTPAAALGYTMPREILAENSLTLLLGDEIAPEKLALKLSRMGFAPVDSVEARGQFAKRGGIVDFWGADMSSPCRVEFFGDEVDRLVSFDPISQRAIESIKEISLLPAREVILDKSARGRIIAEIEKLLKNGDISDEIRERLKNELALANTDLDLNFKDKYLGLIYENNSCLFDYYNIEKLSTVLVVSTNGCRENAEKHIARITSDADGMLALGSVSKNAATYTASLTYYKEALASSLTVHVNSFSGGVGTEKLAGLFGFRSRRTVSYGGAGNASMLFEDVSALKKGLYRTLILCDNAQGADALVEALATNDIYARNVGRDEDFDISKINGGEVVVGVGAYEGFDLLGPKIAVLSMSVDKGKAIMQRRRQQRILKRVGGAGKKIMSHADLSVGDYVVHANYGIGLFEGIETVTVDGVTKDYITIRYAGTDKLFVPCDRLEMIGKYIGDRAKDGTVKLSEMGGGSWQRTKSRAKAAVKDIAKNLINLYAERQRTPGFAFPKDTELEAEFDAEFEYEETESQLIAINEIKADMMKSVPMNRLLCGDVGFGKTEVALRAAFKAILGGKQVALLVPTTILALQHYQTAISRMRGYGVSVEMLSRFKKPKERAEIIAKTAKGSVDLLIGTHAILSKNVTFRDLGLLIIDEEQRFGVVQKEKLREMARNVDTLMLSATPIPRTLNMSMSGINDISVLDEAPGERRPVQTYVLEHDEGIIIDALRRELSRGGQTLYLYNKTEDIDLVAGRISEALPEARVTYAHGKMEKEELEDIWQMLVRGEIDILVCTTIIETGVDLPNANTLVIENAERFGLSQLHQIRGRVGRSERQAYAYFTYRKGKHLNEIAEKRLEAIKEFAEFGAGFKIALRDLEIRGAGNLLGAEQHGYIESVGYDLYIKLLNEAVLEERGEIGKERFESQIIISLSAHIPEHYVKSSAARMEMYKKISFIETRDERDDLYDEFADRFGEVPRTVERLLDVALAKAMAERARIKKIEHSGMKLTFVTEKPDLSVWSELFASNRALSFVGLGSPLIVYRLRKDEDPAFVAAKITSEYVAIMDSESNENNTKK